jgi:ribosome-associated protein
LVGVDEGAGSGWSVLDAFDVMVHVLTRENRAHYRLESLWGDAEQLDVSKLLARRAPRKRAVLRAAPKAPHL